MKLSLSLDELHLGTRQYTIELPMAGAWVNKRKDFSSQDLVVFFITVSKCLYKFKILPQKCMRECLSIVLEFGISACCLISQMCLIMMLDLCYQ